MIESERLIDEIHETQQRLIETGISFNCGYIDDYEKSKWDKILYLELSSLRKQLREVCRKREAEYENR